MSIHAIQALRDNFARKIQAKKVHAKTPTARTVPIACNALPKSEWLCFLLDARRGSGKERLF